MKTIQELYLPVVLEEIALKARGLILVTGITGSGKSTALAAMINHVNQNRRVNVITIEDPIEFLHRDVMSNISQREVGSDTLSFGSALRHVLRQDPDVILVGEIRDMETLDTALKAADTGHLVFSTLHTTDATQTLNRIISFYPPYQHQEIRMLLATALQAVISLRLVPRADGRGRVPARRGPDQYGGRGRQHPRHRKGAQHSGFDRGRHGLVRHAILRPIADEMVQGGNDLLRERTLLLDQPERVRAAGVGRRFGVGPQVHRDHRPIGVLGRAGSDPLMFKKVLIANRGEIALRVIRACRELGIATVAVYSEADRESLHVRFADDDVCIGPPPSRLSYLRIPNLIAAAEITGADAIHPGYGFLAENAEFADTCRASNITFIGPTGDQIRQMGDKATARRLAQEAGVPTVPGSPGTIEDVDQALEFATSIDFPVIIKATAGGGGKGMRIVQDPEQFPQLFGLAQNEALAAFGNGAVYVEKYLEHPRHVEIQVMGDCSGASCTSASATARCSGVTRS